MGAATQPAWRQPLRARLTAVTVWTTTTAAASTAALGSAATPHYSCAADEVRGELMGETGIVCGPRCLEGSFDCPLDVPAGTTAQPQCMLQDVDQAPYCGLMCEVDDQCPSGWGCRRSAKLELGVCMRPLAFAEWAQQGTLRKLDVGLPSRANPSSKGWQIAKAYEALMSLKVKNSIPDGDADVLTIEEMISVARAVHASGGLGRGLNATPGGGRPTMRDGLQRDLGSLAGKVEAEFIHPLGSEMPGENMAADTLFLVLAYFVGGMMYNHKVHGETRIPHLEFWESCSQRAAHVVAYIRDLFSKALAGLAGPSGKRHPDDFGHFGGGPRSDAGVGSGPRFGDRDRGSFENFEPIL